MQVLEALIMTVLLFIATATGMYIALSLLDWCIANCLLIFGEWK
jgi:hypothetical protein